MTEPTEQFAQLTRRGHEVFSAAVRAWEEAARSLAEAARRPGGRLPDVRASVDAAFDFAGQMLAEQREFAKMLMDAGTGLVRDTAERAGRASEPPAAPAALAGSASE